MQKYDRLSIVMDTPNEVSLIGYRPAGDTENADLESGFPCAGRWMMDYLDVVTSIDYAKDVADAMWGTVYFDNGEILCDDLLKWVEYNNEGDHLWWSVRDQSEYELKCEEACVEQDSSNDMAGY